MGKGKEALRLVRRAASLCYLSDSPIPDADVDSYPLLIWSAAFFGEKRRGESQVDIPPFARNDSANQKYVYSMLVSPRVIYEVFSMTV